MKTTLNTEGKIDIPDEIRHADQLNAGDSFELERLTPGHYLLTKQPSHKARVTISVGKDGLPLIRADYGVITSRIVKEIESQSL